MTKKAKKRAPKAPSYWWFGPETTDPLREHLATLVGSARLEVRIDGKKNMTLTVVPVGAEAAQAHETLNKSHYCPPDCG